MHVLLFRCLQYSRIESSRKHVQWEAVRMMGERLGFYKRLRVPASLPGGEPGKRRLFQGSSLFAKQQLYIIVIVENQHLHQHYDAL